MDRALSSVEELACRRGERVLGAHYVGPNAGEVIQGMAVAMRAGATKAHFDDTIGIHPTCAEARNGAWAWG